MADDANRGWILTQQKRVPWRWVFLIVTPWFSNIFVEMLSGNILALSLSKFTSHPLVISSILSANVLFNILIGAPLLYVSDRIWTPIGRRKPFLIAGALPLILAFAIAPFMPSLALFLPFVVLWLASQDIMITNEPLQQEVTPPPQRGRGAAFFQVTVQMVVLFCMVLIFGRFHEVQFVGGHMIAGEQVAYWCGALFLVAVIALIVGFVRELPVKSRLTGERLSPLGFVRGVFGDRELRPVYALVFAMIFMQGHGGALLTLLFVEQWGYTPQQMGTNALVSVGFTVLCTSIAGYFADRVDRIKLYLFGLGSTFVINVAYYLFVRFALPDHRPTLWQIILVGQIIALFGMFIGVVGQPLMYDFIPRAKMGTAAAGLSIVRCAVRWLATVGAGLWVTGYSRLFCAPGTFDYFSLYLYTLLLNSVGLVLMVRFYRRVRRGEIRRAGWQGLEDRPGGASAAPAAGAPPGKGGA
jgi:MFS family permease